MASNAIRTQKTTVTYSTVTPPTTFSPLGEIISFDGPGGKASIIDITNLASIAKEKLPGLPDEGQFSMVCNYSGDDVGQAALHAARTAQTLTHFKVTFTDTSIAAFDAYVMEYKISGKADSKVEVAITLEITGLVTWTAPTVLQADRARNGGDARAGKAA
jgi:predicted secreted protein